MLLNALAGAGIISVAINGGMSLAERALAQSAFRERARVLVYTDAGGEGINLQFTQSASARFGPVLRAAGGVGGFAVQHARVPTADVKATADGLTLSGASERRSRAGWRPRGAVPDVRRRRAGGCLSLAGSW
jgi:hypothetical protein